MNTFENYPDWILKKWQEIADLLAEIIGVPAALIMKNENEFMEVFISSHSENNPYIVGAKEKWSGLYCETVIKTRKKLAVPNALKDKKWDKNPDIKLGMIAYLGFPIDFPDLQPFGTLCILDHRERHFTALDEKLIQQFKNVIELDLSLMQSFELTTRELKRTIVQEITVRNQTAEALAVHQIQLEMQNEELRRVHVELDSERARYFDLYDLAPVGYVTIHENGKILEANLTAASLLEVGRAALVTRPLSHFIFKEDQDLYFLHRERLFETGDGQECELRMFKKDGSTFHAYLVAGVAKDENGAPVCRVVMTDISERKQTEDVLARTQQNYETFFNTIDEFLFVLDQQGNIIHTNSTVVERLGYTSKELFGKPVLMLHPPERREEAGRIVAEMLNGGTEFCPVPIVTKSGVQIPVETRVSHGFWDGKPVIFGVTKDIAKIKLSEEKFSKIFYPDAIPILILLVINY